MKQMQDQIVLITGAARGMGAAFARRLVAEGARVMLTDRLDEEGDALAAELGEAARYQHLDVTDAAQWTAAVAATQQAFGGLDVLVNNAGIATMARLVDFDLAVWRKTLDINLTGVFLGMQAAVPALVARGGGSIVNISSVEGIRGSAGLHAYTASKFGVTGLTKSAAMELAGKGIRVNSVHPGFIVTPMTEGLDAAKLAIPMARGAQPDEVAELVLFLASNASSYCTGAEFVCDGGLTAGIAHR